MMLAGLAGFGMLAAAVYFPSKRERSDGIANAVNMGSGEFARALFNDALITSDDEIEATVDDARKALMRVAKKRAHKVNSLRRRGR
jgi:hypothetical protein